MQKDKPNVVDLNKIISLLISKWYIFALSLILAITFSYLKLRYTTPLFKSSINIRVEDERGGQLNDLFKYGRANGRIDNVLKTESEILKSHSLSHKTMLSIHDLFTFKASGTVLSAKLYPKLIFQLNPIYLDSEDFGLTFTALFTKDKKLIITEEKNKVVIHPEDTFQIDKSTFVFDILNYEYLANYYNNPIGITIDDLNSKSYANASSIEVDQVKGTTILTISYTSDNALYSQDYLNELTKVYIKETVNNKSLVADQTINFIEKQLDQLSENVNRSQQSLADFKAKNKGITPEELSKKEFETLTSIEADKKLEQIRKEIIEDAISDLQRNENKPVKFITFDLEEGSTISLMQKQLNELILEKLGKQQQYNPNSKTLLDYDKKITELRISLINGLNAALIKSNAKLNYYAKLLAQSNSQLTNLPVKQQLLINIERDYKVNEKIYNYLLEKRLESLISKASITPNAFIIDAAESAYKVFPDDKKYYLTSIILAILVSIIFIGLLRMMYDKIPNKETIEMMSSTPVIGMIKKIENVDKIDNYNIHVFHSPKSIFAESIRGLRTNLNFILMGEKHKIVSLTSTVSGEGKTFCTLNLAASLTLLGHKVLIIGCDLRRPKIHLSFRNMNNRTGLTTYLFGKHLLDEVIFPTEFNNLFVIPAGPVPPNPSELLQSQKLTETLTILKEKFDFIFLDTAPIGLVSDSFSIFNQSDVNLYVLRANYSKRDFAIVPDRLSKDNDIKHLYTILNSFDNSGNFYGSIYKNDYGGYYGGGGYYYYGGYYGKGSYGYYGKKSDAKYYRGYYADEEVSGIKKTLWQQLKSLIVKPK